MASNVTLRRRELKNDKESLYLDFYPPIRCPDTMKMSRREYLGIYIYKRAKNEVQREYNNEMLLKAEAIRSIRVQSLINEEFGFLDKHKMKGDFLLYFKEIALSKDKKWMMVYAHFKRFVAGSCTFGEVTVDLIRKFRHYLLTTTQLNHSTKKMAKNSAAGYFSTFRGFLSIAYRDKRIRENINDFLEKIDCEDVRKEYLTLDEVKLLSTTPCNIPILQKAALFSCLTGLRISDILKLEWSEITISSDNGYCMRFRTEKTESETTLPISFEALNLLGERGIGKVFIGLKRTMTQAPLKNWIKQAGINKNITFHCFRHTFATLQIALGTDIYTVSKMLTHKNVTTTQIYADLVSEKKRESANKISLK